MTTQAAVTPFATRVLQLWFVNALWAYFHTGAANSFSPWASSMKTQGPEEHGLVELIESASSGEQVILLEALASVAIAMIDEVNKSFTFQTTLFPQRWQTFKLYLLVLSVLKPAALVEVFSKALASETLASLQTDHGRNGFIALFWDIPFQRCSKVQRLELHSCLAEWMTEHPEHGESPLLKQTFASLIE